MPDTIAIATAADAPVIADLVNRAYRPGPDAAGWTHEAALVAGQRTSADQVLALMRDDSIVLTMTRSGTLIACVHAQKDDDACWIGMLATEPSLQGGGVGKAMLNAAEQIACQVFQAKVLRMSVLSNRPELQAYYERRGFQLTGEVQPYPLDAAVGTPIQSGLLVQSMAKALDKAYL